MGKSFSKAIVHVGLGKTGTSTIQLFLKNNSNELRQIGIHYPILDNDPRPFKENHSIFLNSLFVKNAHENPINIAHRFNTPELLDKLNQRNLKDLNHQFKISDCDTVLFSAEGISTMKKQAVNDLFGWIKTFASEVLVIACLRHPFDGISSEIQQQLKNGRMLNRMYQDPQVKGASKCLEKLLINVDAHSIICYDFVNAVSHERGIIGKFLDVIAVTSNSLKFEKMKNSNTSMSLESCLLLSTLNRLRPKYVKGKIGGGRFAGDLRYFLKLPGQKFILPPNLFKAIDSEINQETSWIFNSIGLSLDKRSLSLVYSLECDPNCLNMLAEYTGLKKATIASRFRQIWEDHNAGNYDSNELDQIALKLSDKLNEQEIIRLTRKKRKSILNPGEKIRLQNEIDRIKSN